MRKLVSVLVCLCFINVNVLGEEPPMDFEKNWPQWRGPYANGVAPYGNPPVEWSENKNIKWKIQLPGLGHATPVIWDNQIFVVSAINTGKTVDPDEGKQTRAKRSLAPFTMGTSNIYQFVIYAINRSDGQILWQRTAREELPHEGVQKTATWASCSPVTDGEHVYAFFGSKGLFCYDMAGNLIWEKDLGNLNIKANWGEGSSPVLYGNNIIINWDHQDQSSLIVLDKKTGNEIWKVARDEKTSWSTPLIVDNNGQQQIITNASSRVRSYDLANGELLWESSGGSAEVIPSPVAADDMVYIMSGGIMLANYLQAIKFTEATGDIADSKALVWTHDKDTPYVSSPLLYDDKLYFLKSNDGTLACFNADSGDEYFSRKRQKGFGSVYASPVGAGGKIFISSRNGSTLVVKHGNQYEVLAVNKLDDSFSASPVVVDNELYLRGEKNLYCIEEK